jgi:hypothetical protein
MSRESQAHIFGRSRMERTATDMHFNLDGNLELARRISIQQFM